MGDDVEKIMGCGDNCSCEKRAEIWESAEGRWLCQAQHCPHYFENGGCKLGKVSLTCDNNNCRWNKKVDGFGIYVCLCMDIHLDANGRCFSFQEQLPVPCPNCDGIVGRPIHVKKTYYKPQITRENNFYAPNYYHVWCPKCGRDREGKNKEEAIKNWNIIINL